MGFGLIVGIAFHPTRPLHPEWSIAMMQLMLSMPINTAVGLIGTRCDSVEKAREKVVDYALQVGAQYVMLVDDDTAPPTNTVRRLLEALADKTVAAAGGIYFTREEHPVPVVGRRRGEGPSWDWKAGERFDAEVLGNGCLIVKTDVFRLIPRPWFPNRDEQLGADIFKEDDSAAFCRKVNEAGFRVVADGGVLPVHLCGMTGRRFVMPEDAPMKGDLQSTPVSV